MLVSGKETNLKYSENNYDWLGKGMYFWENDPDRAWEWAESVYRRKQNDKQSIKEPAVLGAVICLGHCFDLLERENLKKLKEHYLKLCNEFKSRNLELPKNTGGKDYFKRELDCFVINSFVAKQKGDDESQAYDSVRGIFTEGMTLYPTAGFREKDHIQIAIINPNCIKGFFKVRENDKNFREV